MNNHKPAQSAASILHRLFVGRSDVWAEQQSNGAYHPVWDELNEKMLVEHVLGKRTIGVYQLDRHQEVRWIAIDIDLKDSTQKFQDVGPLFKQLVEDLIAVACQHDLSVLIEFSGRRGYHVLIPLQEPIDAAMTRQLGLGLVSAAGEIPQALDAEVFPKQTQLGGGRQLGNLLKLPWGKHQLGTRSQFVDGNLTPIEPWFRGQLEHLRDAPLNDPTTIKRAVRQLPQPNDERSVREGQAMPAPAHGDLVDDQLLRLLRKDRLVRDLFYGDPATLEGYDTRSGAEFALVLKLLWHQATPEQVDLVLRESGIGKWPEATDHYRRQTIAKAQQQIAAAREA